MSVNRLFNERAYSPERIDEHLAALRADGVTLVRSDVLWEVAEPEPPGEDGTHRYDWSFADGIAYALARHGLRWLAIVDYAAPWAASVPGNTHSPPREAADYATFARAFAHRYGRDGAFWVEHPEPPARPSPPTRSGTSRTCPSSGHPSPTPAATWTSTSPSATRSRRTT